MLSLIKAGERDPNIFGMSYNSAGDELFLADFANKVVRVHDNAGEMREVYIVQRNTLLLLYNVCYLCDSDSLLVCLGEDLKANWLVVLNRNGLEWREVQREQTDGKGEICCELSDSRVLIGCGGDNIHSPYMQLFNVVSGSRIARVHIIQMLEKYTWFSATCGTDTLVAMTYPNPDKSVRVLRLRGHWLEELARIRLKWPTRLLWFADRLIVSEWDDDKESHAVIELEVSDTRLERRRKLIAISEKIWVWRWCVMKDGLAIFDYKSKHIVQHSIA